jgi:sugar phosphate permease
MLSTTFKERPPYARKYNSWRIRILYSVIIGYSTFIFCGQNFNIAMPALMDRFEVTKISTLLDFNSLFCSSCRREYYFRKKQKCVCNLLIIAM